MAESDEWFDKATEDELAESELELELEALEKAAQALLGLPIRRRLRAARWLADWIEERYGGKGDAG